MGSTPTTGRAIRTEIMSQDELMMRVRELRERGYSPKEIARTLHVAPAVVAPLIRAMAQEKEAMAPEPAVVGCWASRGWSDGLSVKARPDWPDLEGGDPSASGLVGVVVAREHRYDKVSVCGYLVDVFCLGVKDTLGPRAVDAHGLDRFIDRFFAAFESVPLAVPLQLAQHLVLGAVGYARELGFEPDSSFGAVRHHLGAWSGPSAIGFGRNGKPLFIQGPRDHARTILDTLDRSVGRNNFHFVVNADQMLSMS